VTKDCFKATEVFVVLTIALCLIAFDRLLENVILFRIGQAFNNTIIVVELIVILRKIFIQ